MSSSYVNHYQDNQTRIVEFEELKAALIVLQNSVNALPTGGGAGCVFTSLTKYVCDYYIPTDVFNAYDIDLLYLLGTTSMGWVNPLGNVLNVNAFNDDIESSAYFMLQRTFQQALFVGTASLSFTIDFGSNEINLTAVGWRTPYFDLSVPIEQPEIIEISGSNDDITYTFLSEWVRPKTVDYYEWNSHILPVTTTHYKYLRFTAPIASPSGNFNLNSSGIRLFGEILL